MIFAAMIIGFAVAVIIAVALGEMVSRGLTFAQALWYAPLKLVWRIDATAIKDARKAPAPVIYVICHQSRLDPALALCLLPENTLHILDEASAKAAWLEPYRGLARTIAFNAKHVFVSRRLVRHLKGNGRLAVYLPHDVEPDAKTLRLYRAVARIALRADAKVIPIVAEGTQHTALSLVDRTKAPRRFFTPLRLVCLPPETIATLMERSLAPVARATHALFDRMAETRFEAGFRARSLFDALTEAATLYGPGQIAVEDPITGSLSYRRLMIGVRVLSGRFARASEPGEAVGVLLPNANGVAIAFFALQSAGRVAAMINYTAGPANVASAIKTANVKTVISSTAFVEKASLETLVTAIGEAGADIIWLEELREKITLLEKAAAALLWRRARAHPLTGEPATVLFTSGSEGTPKGVVLSHRNILANVAQVSARIDFSPKDTLFNVLPVFHSFGLTGGMILPLLAGVRLYLYPSPLHYKLIPQVAAKAKPTILFGTDTFLAGYARTAKDEDFQSLRLVVAGAEAVRQETVTLWHERFGADVLEGFGMTEAAPVVAVNSLCHRRISTVGRLLPSIEARIEPVEGIEDGGRLWLRGPNVMLGYMLADRPGELQPPADGWHDTGDIVDIDREGFVAIKGRAKRFAKIAGEMVSLGAVEMLVQALWPEEHHAAVSVPDRRKGERIVLVTTTEKADRTLLRKQAIAAGAPEFMVPNDIITVPDIPVLGTGKTDYVGTRLMALERLGLVDAA